LGGGKYSRRKFWGDKKKGFKGNFGDGNQHPQDGLKGIKNIPPPKNKKLIFFKEF
jgi:hypothetical protein